METKVGFLQRLKEANRCRMDTETKRRKKRTEESFTSAHWHAIQNKDFVGRGRQTSDFPSAASVVVGSRESQPRQLFSSSPKKI